MILAKMALSSIALSAIRVIAFLAVSLLSVPSFALGQAEDAQAARARVKRATAAYNLGHYGEAASEFEEAYRLVQDPALLFNVAQSYRLGGEPEKALTAYKSYLRTAPDGPDRQQAWKSRQDLEQRLLDAENLPAAAPETAPARPQPATPSIAAPPEVPRRQRASVAPTNLAPPPAPTASGAAAATTTIPSGGASPPLYTRWWAWTIVGVVVAGVGTALILGRDTRNPDCLGISPCGSVH